MFMCGKMNFKVNAGERREHVMDRTNNMWQPVPAVGSWISKSNLLFEYINDKVKNVKSSTKGNQGKVAVNYFLALASLHTLVSSTLLLNL